MKDYIGQIDTSLMNDQILNPAWPGHTRDISSITSIIVHHEAEDEGYAYDDKSRYGAEAEYQAKNPSINGLGLEYHYKIDNVGQIMQIRPLTMILWHAANLDVNDHSIAICLDGNFNDQVPTREQYEAVLALLNWLCTQHPEFPASQGDVYAHREVSQLGTACCGNNLFPFVVDYRDNDGNVTVPATAVYQHPELQPSSSEAPVPSQQPAQSPPVPSPTVDQPASVTPGTPGTPSGSSDSSGGVPQPVSVPGTPSTPSSVSSSTDTITSPVPVATPAVTTNKDNLMQSFVNYLQGRKTYLIAALIGIVNVLLAQHLITVSPATLDTINGILGALGLASLRAAVTKSGN